MTGPDPGPAGARIARPPRSALQALLAGALALAPVAAAPPASAAEPPCVGVVVDFGALARPVSAECVRVPPGSSGLDVLTARADRLGVPAPRLNAQGLLCAIDGVPESGCGESSVDGGYDYWSYWHRQGDGDWSYSTAGAFQYTINGAEPVEGWAWVEGGGLASTEDPDGADGTDGSDGTDGIRRPADVPYRVLADAVVPTATDGGDTEPAAAGGATGEATGDGADGGFPGGLVLGLGLAGALGAAAAVRARRRRSHP